MVPERIRELWTLRSNLPKRIEDIQRRVGEIQRRFDSHETHIGTFRQLAKTYTTIHATRHDLPSGLQQVKATAPEALDVPGAESGPFPVYQLQSNIFGQEICLRADASPLRVAAFGRLQQRRDRHRQQRLRETIYVATLRLRVLESVLERYELTGVVPKRVDAVDVREHLEAAENRSTDHMGRPPKARDIDNYREKRVNRIRDALNDASNWHVSGRHRGKPKWKDISSFLGAEHPQLFRGASTFSLTDSAIRQIVDDADIIDLDAIREQLGIEPPLERN